MITFWQGTEGYTADVTQSDPSPRYEFTIRDQFQVHVRKVDLTAITPLAWDDLGDPLQPFPKGDIVRITVFGPHPLLPHLRHDDPPW